MALDTLLKWPRQVSTSQALVSIIENNENQPCITGIDIRPRFATFRHVQRLLLTIHPPKLNLSIITSRHNQRHGGMESSPVNTSIVAFQDIFDHNISATEQISLAILAIKVIFIRL
jgi:hypothetical protein